MSQDKQDPAERDKELMTKFLVEEKIKDQQGTLTVLESLRRSRKSRGGVGAPLQVPTHLGGNTLILTDEPGDVRIDIADDGETELE